MELFIQEAAQFGIRLGEVAVEQFARYQALLMDWNERMNLTAVSQPRQIQQRHFLDSLTCATVMGELNGRLVIDVGSGAGFPGLPLKIIYPEMRLVLVESIGKKAQFLEAVITALGLSDVQVVTERAETLGQTDGHREQYDWAVARAVAELRVLAEYLLPLCRVGGNMLAQKGEKAVAETAVATSGIQLLGGGQPHLHPIHLLDRDETHYLVVIPKTGKTPLSYPRRVGVPAKRPL